MAFSSEYDRNCTIIIHRSHHQFVGSDHSLTSGSLSNQSVASDQQSSTKNVPQQPRLSDIQRRLEDPKDVVKYQALKEVVLWVMQPGGAGSSNADGGGPSTSGLSSTSTNLATRLLMTVIRFIVPSNDHHVKKLLLLYWEIVDKQNPDGTLREEMILVCNALRNDLNHCNEYVRGSTLRLLCKLRYIKILEPLVESIIANLSHSHAYVRRNAVMCVYTMVKSFGSEVIPHAAEEVEKLLLVEGDLSTKRNAFLMLLNCDLTRATNYVLSVQDVVSCLGDIFQLVLLELLRRVSKQNPSQKNALLRIIVSLVDSCSAAVAYEGAAALLSLSSSPVALKAATRAYISLLTRQADNNVKLVVLDRLKDVLTKHKGILEEFVVDILRVLSCPSLEVRKKALDISLCLVSHRTVQEITNILKKELIKTISFDVNSDAAMTPEYQHLLVRGMRHACSEHLDVAKQVMFMLLDFLTDKKTGTATEVVTFVREMVSTHPDSRSFLLPRIVESIPDISQCRVLRVCLWLVGEYCEDNETRSSIITTLYEALCPMPFPIDLSAVDETKGSTGASGASPTAQSSTTAPSKEAKPERKVQVTTRTVILPDGTYGTEDVFESVDDSDELSTGAGASQGNKPTSKLRGLVVGGDFLLASMISITITKLCLQEYQEGDNVVELPKNLQAKALLILASLLKMCQSHPSCGETSDACIRINQALRGLTLLVDPNKSPKKVKQVRDLCFPSGRDALSKVITLEREAESQEGALTGSVNLSAYGTKPTNDESVEFTEPDCALVFRQLKKEQGQYSANGDMDDTEPCDIQTALGLGPQQEGSYLFQQRLAKVQQMTGLADPVYVEAFLQVHQFDIVVELLVINRANETLQNVNVELSTHGDLKIVERASPVTLLAGQSQTLRASIKVQSTETGIIFGHVSYDKKSATDKEYLVLNELHVDLLDFIQRSWVGELSFRSMWSEFEWENKITINTTITDVATFLEHVMRQTNMTVVGKYAARKKSEFKSNYEFESSKSQADEYIESVKKLLVSKKMTEGSFFAVNLYSKSIFGEDALANVSIEKLPDSKLAGNIRIRSRTQGIALSLGDRITVVQRGLTKH